jgi:hypothetical protein
MGALSTELLGGANIDEHQIVGIRLAGGRHDHLVAKSTDPVREDPSNPEVRYGYERPATCEGPSLQLPRLPAPVQELHGLESAELQHPVRERREPVVAPAVEHHSVAPSNAAAT